MGKSSISMAIFNSYVCWPDGNPLFIHSWGPRLFDRLASTFSTFSAAGRRFSAEGVEVRGAAWRKSMRKSMGKSALNIEVWLGKLKIMGKIQQTKLWLYRNEKIIEQYRTIADFPAQELIAKRYFNLFVDQDQPQVKSQLVLVLIVSWFFFVLSFQVSKQFVYSQVSHQLGITTLMGWTYKPLSSWYFWTNAIGQIDDIYNTWFYCRSFYTPLGRAGTTAENE